MARFSFLNEGTSGSKRKNSNNKEEKGLKKRACARSNRVISVPEEEEEEDSDGPYEKVEFDEEEEEDSDGPFEEVEFDEDNEESDGLGDEEEDDEEIGENQGCRRGNTAGEFTFHIDLDVLDCSICFEPLRPPIFQCKNGHIACSYCCPKLSNKCHFCNKFIGRRRCIALEKVIESITSPCKFARHGCQAVVSFADKASHEEGCSYVALFCPVTNCNFSDSQFFLFHHAKSKHCNISKSFSYDKPFLITLQKQQPSMVLLGEDRRFFLLLNSHDVTRPGNALSVICVAPSTPEREFSYELSVGAGGSSLRLRTSAETVRMWNGVHPSKAFLLVPDGFYASSSTNAQLSVMVCIYKCSHAT